MSQKRKFENLSGESSLNGPMNGHNVNNNVNKNNKNLLANVEVNGENISAAVTNILDAIDWSQLPTANKLVLIVYTFCSVFSCEILVWVIKACEIIFTSFLAEEKIRKHFKDIEIEWMNIFKDLQ